MAEGELVGWGGCNGLRVYYNCHREAAVTQCAGKAYYLGRIGTAGIVSEKGKYSGIPFVLMAANKRGANTGMTDAVLWRESQQFPDVGMFESAHCFVKMAEPEKTIKDLKDIPDYAAAMQHLAANAATAPILESLLHLRDMVG